MGSGASQNFNQATQGTPFGAGGAYSPVSSGNFRQAVQQAQGNPMAAWMLPMRALTGIISQGGQPQQQPQLRFQPPQGQLGNWYRPRPNPPPQAFPPATNTNVLGEAGASPPPVSNPNILGGAGSPSVPATGGLGMLGGTANSLLPNTFNQGTLGANPTMLGAQPPAAPPSNILGG
jgi:hypothetical protein